MKNYPTPTLFFDLDGTLLDTAPDLLYAMNQILEEYNKPTVMLDQFRSHAGHGSKAMIKYCFEIDETNTQYKEIKTKFLKVYQQNLTKQTRLFPGMEQVLDHLDAQQTNWGVITSKPEWLTKPLLDHFGIIERSKCIVSGDTLTQRKPHPAPLQHACKITNTKPTESVYIGDTEIDIIAAKAAGMQTILATYGYHYDNSPLEEWDADFMIQSPLEIISWLKGVYE